MPAGTGQGNGQGQGQGANGAGGAGSSNQGGTLNQQQQNQSGSNSNDGQGQGQGNNGQNQLQAQTFENIEGWLAAQPAELQASLTPLIEKQVSGLKTALNSERTQNKDLAARLNTAIKGVEEGSEARKQLDAIASQLSEENQKAAFYDEAHREGALNLRLAYLAAKDNGFLESKTGRIDWKALKADYPQLFQVAPPARSNAGTGTGNQSQANNIQPDMNRWIRDKAR